MNPQLEIECNIIGIITEPSGRVKVLLTRNHMTSAGLEWIIKSAFRDLNNITRIGSGTDSFKFVLGTGAYTAASSGVETPLSSIKKDVATSPASTYGGGLLQMTSEEWSGTDLPASLDDITNVGIEIDNTPNTALNVAPFTFSPDGSQTLRLVFRLTIRGG